MKTPREILLERHRDMDARLDALRKEVVAEHAVVQREAIGRRTSLAGKLWDELVVPCRRIWLGMGAAWLVILVAHLAVTDSPAAPQLAKMKAVPSGPEVMAALKEQKIWMTQLLEPAAPPPPGGASSGPRSERRNELPVV